MKLLDFEFYLIQIYGQILLQETIDKQKTGVFATIFA